MHTYRVEVTRDGKWWMVSVPDLAGHRMADGSVNLSETTQARRLSDVARQARELICTVTDSSPSAVGLDITVTVDRIDVTARARRILDDRELADRHAAAAREQSIQLARDLAAHGVPVRDVGQVLGVSFQRAQQLISVGCK